MSAAFGFLSFIALIVTIVGLIKPAWLELATRGKVLMWWGGAFVILFAIGIAIPNTPTQSQPPTQNVAQAPSQATPSTPSTTPVKQATPAATPKPAPAPVPAPTPIPAPQPTPAPVPVQPQTVMSISGSGSKSTQTFTVNDSWQMQWSYDCSSTGGQGNFQVFIFTGAGAMSEDNEGVNQLGASGSDTEYYHTGGSYYLEVNSECNWNIKVTD